MQNVKERLSLSGQRVRLGGLEGVFAESSCLVGRQRHCRLRVPHDAVQSVLGSERILAR